MFKKLLIAVVAVAVGIAVVKGTKVGSYCKLLKSQATSWANKQISLETQIARLRVELNDLQKEDDKHFDQVARLDVDVARRERQMIQLKAELAKKESNIRQMRAEVASGSEFIVVDGTRFPKEDVQEQLRIDFVSFQIAEERLKSEEEQLKSLRKNLLVNRQKLKSLEKAREDMKNDLIRLETALTQERMAAAAAQTSVVLDDSNYSRLRKEIEEIKFEIDVKRKERELRGEATRGPVRAVQDAKKRDQKIDQDINARFGTEKVSIDKK
jgi:predicted  nucleic acid-binding Zn-ribbon protein